MNSAKPNLNITLFEETATQLLPLPDIAYVMRLGKVDAADTGKVVTLRIDIFNATETEEHFSGLVQSCV
jgi:hypothetical protein